MMVCYNYMTGEIADQLTLSRNSVKTHIFNILRKFGVHSRHELLLLLADFDFQKLLNL